MGLISPFSKRFRTDAKEVSVACNNYFIDNNMDHIHIQFFDRNTLTKTKNDIINESKRFAFMIEKVKILLLRHLLQKLLEIALKRYYIIWD
ncbi:MAG TPA: hypothetical protein IAB62_05710 [Candidatus Coprocola pullicola]|nr:hypothetical protein [Candidatus Coprocola pullicola]